MPFGFRTHRKFEIATLSEWSQKSYKINSININRILFIQYTYRKKIIYHYTSLLESNDRNYFNKYNEKTATNNNPTQRFVLIK